MVCYANHASHMQVAIHYIRVSSLMQPLSVPRHGLRGRLVQPCRASSTSQRLPSSWLAFSWRCSASGICGLTSVGMPGHMACRQLSPGVFSPHQCWLEPRGVLGGTFAQHDSHFNLTLMACYSSAVLFFCWLAIVTAAGLIVLLVLFGVLRYYYCPSDRDYGILCNSP